MGANERGYIRLAAVKAAIERRLQDALGEVIAVDYSDLVDWCKRWDIGVQDGNDGERLISKRGLATFAKREYPKLLEVRREFLAYVQDAMGGPLPEPKPPPPPEIDKSKIFLTGPEKTREELKARFGVDPYTLIPRMMYDPRFFGPRFRGEDKQNARMPDGWTIRHQWNLDVDNWEFLAISPSGAAVGPFEDADKAIDAAHRRK